MARHGAVKADTVTPHEPAFVAHALRGPHINMSFSCMLSGSRALFCAGRAIDVHEKNLHVKGSEQDSMHDTPHVRSPGMSGRAHSC